MAKKQVKKTEAVEPQPIQVEDTVVQEVETFIGLDETEPQGDQWEIKDRVYLLKDGLSPLSYKIPGRNLMWFDEEKGYEREVTYTINQRTAFSDEFNGPIRLGHIVFRNGTLRVPKSKTVLQKIMSNYHPYKDNLYIELDEVRNASYQVDNLEMELDAMNAAVGLDIDMAEAIMRTEIGSRVAEMSSKELKRDLLMFAKRNPGLFLDLMDDDNVHLRNIGIKATELSIINLSGDNRTFFWGSNNRKLMTVPFDEHPYSALASWFKTDEGMEVLNSIEKRLN